MFGGAHSDRERSNSGRAGLVRSAPRVGAREVHLRDGAAFLVEFLGGTVGAKTARSASSREVPSSIVYVPLL